MIKIAICTADALDGDELKRVVKEYALEQKILVDIKVHNAPEDVLKNKAADIYFITGGLTTSDEQLLGREIHKRYPDAFIVCIAVDVSEAVIGYRFRAAACISKPFKQDDIIPLLDDLRTLIRDTFIVVQTKTEDVALKIKDIQYINIEGRNLCYHLSNGEQIHGQTLRAAFKNYVKPLKDFPNFLAVGLSLIINLDEIERIENTKVVFKNKSYVHVPSTHHELVEARWQQYFNKED